MPSDAVLAAPSARGTLLQPIVLRLLTVGFLGFVFVYIAIPLLVTLLMSFNDGQLIRFPINAWSTRWYGDFFASPQWTQALWNSLQIAVGTTVLSTAAGTLAAWAFERYDIPGKSFWYILIMMSLFMPGVVLGLGVAIAFGGISIFGFTLYGSKLLVIIAHSLWAMPLVFMTIDHRIVEASYDLGGRPAQTFFEIVLPSVSTGLVSSALFAFVVSLNEYVMALLLTDRDTQTLPKLMGLSLRSAATPMLAVAAVLLASAVLVSLVLLMLWYTRQLRKTAR
jgi:putative spermidine/putrescine transport system permease protein/spermidine/putrescine transport system permease protein